MKKAIITGITGQDGAYLAELLLKKGYEESHLLTDTVFFNFVKFLFTSSYIGPGNLLYLEIA